METRHKLHPIGLSPLTELQTLVEHRSVYTLNQCELNVFETHQQSKNVRLCFNDLVLTTMLRGKKVMHLFGSEHFDYLPGESVIVPEKEEMIIDFPDASQHNPTQCIALAVNGEVLKETIGLLNEKFPKAEDNDMWRIDMSAFHLQNTFEITNAVDRLVHVSRENIGAKEVLASFTLKELLIRLMQTQARHLILDNYKKYLNNHRFAYIAAYIRENLAENLNIDRLSDLACMSKPNFFRYFKREFGLTPIEFIIQERIKLAKKLLADPLVPITEVCFRSGFNNTNYFFKLFRKYEGTTPKAFRENTIHHLG
ncbi:AraC family transcriptional regulator [Xanthocytophaga agilis]|uniref:AraC family transcriptional regulator n=1 Tax=Xanthocytophaga agilis TaxID=3048010 RepID=A0AAE3UH48_9BACT|nr:AraC family transcriptional regulator [Xanthocytophaga agilis]MDJ1502278.1 AraC family transcriptional regulator [Xanthocytophaga agilis]